MRCRIYQRNLSMALAAGRPLSRRLQRHLATCERCRAVHEELTALARGLRSAGDQPAPPLPAGLRERIVRIVREDGEGAPAPRSTRSLSLRLLAAVAAAACVLLAVGLLVTVWWPPAEPPVVRREPAPRVRPIFPPGPGDLGNALLADVAALTSEPLADEMRCLARQTRQIGSAMFACVPTELVPGADGQWLDALLPGLTDSPGPAPTPSSRPRPDQG